MKVSNSEKNHIYLWICILLLLFIAYMIAIRLYTNYETKNTQSPYVGTYVIESQGDKNCQYIAIGDSLDTGEQAVVLYRQTKNAAIISGLAKNSKNQLVMKKHALSITEKKKNLIVQYNGDVYQAEKISDGPIISGNQKAGDLFFHYYE